MKTSALYHLYDQIAAVVDERLLSGGVVTIRRGETVVFADLADAHVAITRYLGSLTRLEEVVVDIGKLQAFGRRYPWKASHLPRSDHIRFVWMLFLHLTYTYEERLKLFVGQMQEICERVPVEGRLDSKLEFSVLRPIISAYTKERGQHLHQWPNDRLEVQMVGMLELMAAWDDSHSSRVREHYREARLDMLATIRGVHGELLAAYNDLVKRHSAFGVDLAKHFAALVAVARSRGVVVSATRGQLDTSTPSFASDRISQMRRRRCRSSQ